MCVFGLQSSSKTLHQNFLFLVASRCGSGTPRWRRGRPYSESSGLLKDSQNKAGAIVLRPPAPSSLSDFLRHHRPDGVKAHRHRSFLAVSRMIAVYSLREILGENLAYIFNYLQTLK